ncbi:transcription/translation regulatory transformer protein RfaH [Shewanella sp. SR44-3]|uniref:transcription/translation regulatory transformer protein RfaH n=1 Tax=Shewanella sp. SR44-3 TaxID=2760936 RepID=UPI0015F9AF30|nr:transcription/translation regulatory transformer protein RfaH [Shewanella sp. SR44-3]MBB1269279.1 transcription/translation regulatory transformer protein RfaH [Shewanella sp. SR44-3]
MKAWYLLYCKPKSELRAQQNLALQQVESYLPVIKEQKTARGKTKVVEVPLFPNYLFIHFDPTEFSVSKIHNTRGASRIIGCKELMTPINDAIIAEIKHRVGNHQLEVEPGLIKGDKVRFTQGPFVDLDAIFDENCANQRCNVLFTIMGQQKSLQVDIDQVVRC